MNPKNKIAKDKYAITGHKLLWHLDRVNQWQKGERITPLHIELGITTGCNLACKFCYGIIMWRTSAEKRFDMPKEAILRLFKDAKGIGVKSITLIGEGENTLNPHFYDILDYARKINLDLALATNAVEFKKEKIKDMLEALTYMKINIGAATPESYLSLHGRNKFADVIKNIKTCVETKKKYGLKTTIGMQMVLMEENIKDIIPMAKLGKELGVDYLIVKPCSDTPDKRIKAPSEKYLDLMDIYKKAETYSDNNYTVIVKWKKLSNLGLNEFKTCYGTQFIIAINGKGDVGPCGHLLGDRIKEFTMGNIIKQSLKDIVSSERYWQIQKKVQTLDVNRECESNCLHCYINQFLEQLKNPPDHINFV